MARISIAGVQYTCKKAVLARAKNLLAAADLSVRNIRGVTVITGKVEAFAAGLYALHRWRDPRAEMPIGYGIRQEPNWSSSTSYSRQFVALMADGGVKAFYKRYISPTGDTAMVLRAFHQLVKGQMAHEQEKLPLMVRCGLTGRMVPKAEIDLDYADIEFAELVDAFLEHHGIAYADVQIGKDNKPTGQKLSIPFLQLHALLIRQGGLMPVARPEHWRKKKTVRVAA